MKENVAVLINSCDAYQDVVSLNLCAIQEHWSGCHFPIYINTESTIYNSDVFNITTLTALNSNNHQWGTRIKDSLARINEELIIVLYDDYILESKVDEYELNKLIQKMTDNRNIDCFYLKHTNFLLSYNKQQNIYIVDESNYYRVNSGPALWRKETLLKLLDSKDNPWAWEFFAMYRKSAKGLLICSVPKNSKDIYDYNHIKGGAVYRGKWVEEVVLPKLKKYNLNINIEERGVLKMNDLKPRTLLWKLQFFKTGFKMVGFRSLNLITHVLKARLKIN